MSIKPLTPKGGPGIKLLLKLSGKNTILQFLKFSLCHEMKKNMFLGASGLIFEKAKALRNNMTHAELIL